jgi:hypothetical protein
MKRALWKRLVCCLGAAGAVALALPILGHSLGADVPGQKGKNAVPARVAVPAAVKRIRPADVSKMGIEMPTQELLAKNTASAPPGAAASPFTNPRVQPGKVRWHATVEQANAASAASGKPVLIFSMMGRLDEKFC